MEARVSQENNKKEREILLTASQGELGGRGHGVALVEDDKLDAAAHELLSAAETFDLVADHVDAAVVTGVQLQRHVLVVLPVYLLRNRQHARRLACPWRPVEEQVRHVLGLNKLAD